MPTRLHPKLSARYYSSFVVLKQVRPVAYWLQLPQASRIDPILHAYQLKLVVGTHPFKRELPKYRDKF